MTKRTKQKEKVVLPLILAVALTMRLAQWETAEASFFVLAGYALFGRAQAIQALFLSWLFSSLSQGVTPDASWSIGPFTVMAGAAMSVFLRSSLVKGSVRLYWPVILTLLLGLFVVLHSLLFSPFKDVSILKAVSWMLVMSTLLAAWAGLDLDAQERLEHQLFGGLIAISLLSLPLLATDIGYLRDGYGFQGILNHPQAFGQMEALLVAWLIGRFAERHLPWWQVGILTTCLILVVLSAARTAGGALVLGVALPLILFLLVKPSIVWPRLLRLGMGRMALVAIVAAGMLFAALVGYWTTEQLGEYLTKRSGASGVLEAANLSRGGIFYSMIDNIEQHPLRGIGFGIGSDPWMMAITHHPLYGLPTSAPIEKAVMPVAVMEELGIPGFVLVAAWMWMLLRSAARAGIVRLVVITTALLINFGEFVFFSPGGLGLLLLVLVAWTASYRADTRSAAEYMVYREQTKHHVQGRVLAD